MTSDPAERRERPQVQTSDAVRRGSDLVVRAHKPLMPPISASYPPMVVSTETPGKADLTRRIAEMEEELKLKQRQLESALARERERDRQELREESTRVAKATRRSLGTIAEHPSSRQSETNSISTAATPLAGNVRPKKTMTSQLSATGSFTGILVDRDRTSLTAPRAMTSVSGNTAEARPFSPTHLTTKDAQDIWIRIFERFSQAANLLCHGEDVQRNHTST